MKEYVFTSESVTEGHPDKVADRISDAILDAYLQEDRKNNRKYKEFSRVAVETIVFTGGCLLVGQITSKSFVNIPLVVRNTIKDIGYDITWGYDPDYIAVITSIDPQSPDISIGVENPKEIRDKEDISDDTRFGAGDQGMMFGFACNETKELMPAPILLAHRLAYRLSQVRKQKILDYLGPDGKTQVSIYYQDNKPTFLTDIVLSSQHKDGIPYKVLVDDIISVVIEPVLDEFIQENQLNKNFFDKDKTRIHINPTGRFVIGGPRADSGLTGRKVIVDTYGGYAHGGGSFSGKDPTKVDRSGAYMARYIAKNIVASGLAKKCLIRISYVIGGVKPTEIGIDTFGTAKVPEEKILKIIPKVFDLTPRGIIDRLNLLRPIYRKTACFGHFGREEPEFTWERKDKVKEILSYFK